VGSSQEEDILGDVILMIAGVDEAGRGPVIGPLVVAGVSCAIEEIKLLESMGVTDSKLLTRRKRELFYSEITSNFSFYTVYISPAEIDRALRNKISLNLLEAEAFSIALNELSPEKAFVDCVEREPGKFIRNISRTLKVRCRLVAEHKADLNYPIVSAASIIAKVERDREIAKIREEFGDFGSGYPGDSKTILFLESIIEEDGELPYFIRSSWKTVKRLRRRSENYTLDMDYF